MTILAVIVAGLNQMGASFFVKPLFNGAMLIMAVGAATTNKPSPKAVKSAF